MFACLGAIPWNGPKSQGWTNPRITHHFLGFKVDLALCWKAALLPAALSKKLPPSKSDHPNFRNQILDYLKQTKRGHKKWSGKNKTELFPRINHLESKLNYIKKIGTPSNHIFFFTKKVWQILSTALTLIKDSHVAHFMRLFRYVTIE